MRRRHPASLQHEAETFSRRLGIKFPVDIENDLPGFKRRLFAWINRSLPSKAGRPLDDVVTRAYEMRKQGKDWQEVYRECLIEEDTPDARQLKQQRLRSAVRARAHRQRYRPKTKSAARKSTEPVLPPAASPDTDRLASYDSI
jgi:hypothetical protein